MANSLTLPSGMNSLSDILGSGGSSAAASQTIAGTATAGTATAAPVITTPVISTPTTTTSTVAPTIVPTTFDAQSYLSANPDVANAAAAAGTGETAEQFAYRHWNEFGQTEGRQTSAGTASTSSGPATPTVTAAAEMPSTDSPAVTKAASNTIAAINSRTGRKSTVLTTRRARSSRASEQSPSGGTIAGSGDIYTRKTLG